MPKKKAPITQAVRFLRSQAINFSDHPYSYEDKGGTKVSSRELGVEEHSVVKTLVFQDESKDCYLVLMHGDRQVSTKQLARILGVKSLSPCTPTIATKVTGYQVGGISPFGTRKKLTTYVEESILSLERLYINGGKRGYLVGISPAVLTECLGALPVKVGI